MYLRSCTSSVILSYYITEMTNKKVLQICSSGRGFLRQGAGVFWRQGRAGVFLTPVLDKSQNAFSFRNLLCIFLVKWIHLTAIKIVEIVTFILSLYLGFNQEFAMRFNSDQKVCGNNQIRVWYSTHSCSSLCGCVPNGPTWDQIKSQNTRPFLC